MMLKDYLPESLYWMLRVVQYRIRRLHRKTVPNTMIELENSLQSQINQRAPQTATTTSARSAATSNQEIVARAYTNLIDELKNKIEWDSV